MRLHSYGLLLTLGVPSCFAPNVPSSMDTDGETSSGSDSTAGPANTTSSTGPSSSTDGTVTATGGSGDTTASPADTGSSGESSGPEILVFTANGVESDLEVTQASAVELHLEAIDDGEIVSVVFLYDDGTIATGVGMGDAYDAEWIVSGAELNGVAPLQAVVTDDDGNVATASINSDFDMPNGGLIEGWNFDNGFSTSAYGIAPSPDGDDVVWTGAAELDEDAVALRVDRAQGGAWQSNLDTDSTFGADITRLEDGGYLVAGSLVSGGNTTTGLFRYTAGGASVGQSSINGAPTNGPTNWALGLEQDGDARLYVMGFYGSAAPASYLLRLTDDLSVDWKRDVSNAPETDGSPFTYDFDVHEDGTVAVVGSRVVGADRVWLGIYDASGDLQDQLTLNSEFETSIGYDVAWGDAGLVLAGTANEGDGWMRLVRAYDEGLVERWTVQGAANGDFAQAVTVDDFGRTLVASTEGCELNAAGGLFDTCVLALRSYDDEGQLRWEHLAEGGDPEFNGPVLFLPGFKADLETDRFGYVYVSAQHRLPLGGGERRSEWWMEKHHP